MLIIFQIVRKILVCQPTKPITSLTIWERNTMFINSKAKRDTTRLHYNKCVSGLRRTTRTAAKQ